MSFTPVWLIAKSVLIEALRRKEIYTIVLISTLLIGSMLTINFFHIEGLVKFYREISLKAMSIATSLTVIVLAARQLPREFEKRTIYPMLAKPISRGTFLLGKFLGVMLAAAFCFSLFMGIYLGGTLYLGEPIPWIHFIQYVWLQMLMMAILATLSFWLSMMLNFDAAITLGAIFYLLGATITTMIIYLAPVADALFRAVLVVLNYGIPQLTLLDFSEKTVHATDWPPLSLATLGILTLYAGFYSILYFSFALICFRRRPL